MAKKKKIIKKRPVTSNAQSRLKQKEKRDLLDRFDAFINKRHSFFLWFFTILGGLFALLMFEGKISVGFDDALYIQSAANYVEDFFGFWHGANAPLYVFILTIPVAIFGVNLTIIKLLGVVFFMISIIVIYRAFQNRIPGIILFFAMLFYSTNWATTSYASLTYQEAFFIVVQAFFLWWFFKFIDTKESQPIHFKSLTLNSLKPWLVLGLLLFTLHFTRTVAIAAVGAVVVYFIWYSRYKGVLLTILSTAIFYFLITGIKKLFWGDVSQFGQAGSILQIDPYDSTKGYEDVAGFIKRFLGNIEVYFSQRFLAIISLRPETALRDTFYSILTCIPIGVGIIFSAVKKNKYLFFASLYCLALCALTFIVLQTSWGQLRFIMIYLPFLLIISFYGLYQIFKFPIFKKIQILYLIPILLLFYINISKTFSKIQAHFPETEAYFLRGDIYKGFTPDWVNYLKMSEWCGDNLPEEAYVACRKAPMSFIYANGKKFYLIASASPQLTAEEKLQRLQDAGVTHIIVATLRADPSRASERVINTIHRYIQPISQKYPNKFKQIHKIGTAESATLYEIIY